VLPESGGDAPARTWQQVLANGGPAIIFALAHRLTGFDPLLVGAAATIAATTADTWATELGRAIGGVPWSIRTRRRVPPGTSGAVSGAGTVATVAGARWWRFLRRREGRWRRDWPGRRTDPRGMAPTGGGTMRRKMAWPNPHAVRLWGVAARRCETL
jgi:hypothetical protein